MRIIRTIVGGALLCLLLTFVDIHAEVNFPRIGGAAVHQCVEVVNGKDVLVSSHSLEKNAIAACVNQWLKNPKGVYEVDVSYRIQISVSTEAQAQILGGAIRDGNYPPPQPEPPSDWNTANIGSGECTSFTDSSGTLTITATGSDQDNGCFVYQDAGSGDVQLIYRVVDNGSSESDGAYCAGAIRTGTGSGNPAVLNRWRWPSRNVGNYRLTQDGAVSAGLFGDAGYALPVFGGLQRDQSADTASVWETDEVSPSPTTDWRQIDDDIATASAFPSSVLAGFVVFPSSSTDPVSCQIDTVSLTSTLTLVDSTDPDPPPPSGSDFPIATGTSSVDCSSLGVAPGDTITLLGTARGPISFSNCVGSDASPITLRNDTTESGPLVITTSGTGNQVLFTDIENVVIDGTGKWVGAPSGVCGVTVSGATWTQGKTQCGIRIVHGSGSGPNSYMKFYGYSTKFTVKGVECAANTTASGSGICFDINDHTIKLADNPGVWREDITFTQNYLHDAKRECMYLGPNWSQGDLQFRNVEISNNITEVCGRQGINGKAWTSGTNKIFNNFVRDTGNEKVNNGIGLNNAIVDVYNNWIEDADQDAIGIAAPDMTGSHTLSIYNNVFLSPTRRGVQMSGNAGVLTAQVYNNTGVSTGELCFNIGSAVQSGFVRDNICAATSGISSSITETNNRTGTIAAQNFANSGAKNYRLTASSPACNAGTSGAPADDHVGTSRPQDGVDDQGAFEFVGTCE